MNSIYLKCFFCNIIDVFTVSFDQFNASLLELKYFFLKKKKKNLTDPKVLNRGVDMDKTCNPRQSEVHTKLHAVRLTNLMHLPPIQKLFFWYQRAQTITLITFFFCFILYRSP